jgi:hypothetical protein
MRMPGTRQSRRVGLYVLGLVAMAAFGMTLPLPSASAGSTVVPVSFESGCTPQHLSGCTGTDDPTDGTPLIYCGPDGRCTPVADEGHRTTADSRGVGGHHAHR